MAEFRDRNEVVDRTAQMVVCDSFRKHLEGERDVWQSPADPDSEDDYDVWESPRAVCEDCKPGSFRKTYRRRVVGLKRSMRLQRNFGFYIATQFDFSED